MSVFCAVFDKESVDDARRVLTLLCFSSRPLTVNELIDGIAVDLREPAHLDLRRRLQDVDDIRGICPGLIDIVFEEDESLYYNHFVLERSEFDASKDDNEGGEDEEEEKEEEDKEEEEDDENDEDDEDEEDNGIAARLVPAIRIAHFSVQEYLESDRIQEQRAAAFALKSSFAHAEIAEISLVYLREPELSKGNLDLAKLKRFPLACFAATSWRYHYQSATDIRSKLHPLILEVLQSPNFHRLLRLNNVQSTEHLRPPCEGIPIFYAARLGLAQLVQELIDESQGSANNRNGLNIAKSDVYDIALEAAAMEGHVEIVKMLLDAGANVNAQDRNILSAAVSNGCGTMVVKTLLEAKADVNARTKSYANALWAASAYGNEKVVQMLLDAKADVNANVPLHGTALVAASLRMNEGVMQVLIRGGADVNARCFPWGNVLGAVLSSGESRSKEKIVQILIAAGAVESLRRPRFTRDWLVPEDRIMK